MKKVALVRFSVMAMLVTMLLALPTRASAWEWVDSSRWDTWNNGDYWVQQDIWGTSTVGQTIYANSFSNWEVVANYSGGGIKSYPAVGRNIGKSISSLSSVTSWYTASNGSGSYDNAYDIWLNGSANEVMIWQSWNGTQPIASSYNSSGQAIPTESNVSIGGTTYNFYTRGTVFSFLRTSQTDSAWTDILAVLKWLASKGYVQSSETLTDVQFGWEIINTNGSQTFAINGYYCDFN